MKQTYDILVTDNDDDVRCLMTEVLTFEGYSVMSLPSNRLTLDTIKEIEPLLVIIDLQPYSSGVTTSFLAQIAHHEETQGIGVLVTTTQERLLKGATRSLDPKCCLPLLKPFDLTQFLAKVRHLVCHQTSPEYA